MYPFPIDCHKTKSFVWEMFGKSKFRKKIPIVRIVDSIYFGSLKEDFMDTIRLNTSISSVVSL